MHYHLEIVMPPTDAVEAALAQILDPFYEGLDRNDENANGHPFWDFWSIGGRWSGAKVQAMFSEERMQAFHAALSEARVTVSGLISGKEELSPSDQIPAVDALWCEHFPESPIKQCPLFKHYTGNVGDVMRLADVPAGLTASRVIIAGPHYKGEKLEAVYMIQDEAWNGVTHVKCEWDGKVRSAIEKHLERIKSYRPEYIEKMTPQPDWLVVTIDYHS